MNLFNKIDLLLRFKLLERVEFTGFYREKRRQLVSVKDKNKNIYYARRLTPLETWRFMGMTDDDFNKVAKYNSNTNLYRQSGNSIVVNVLEAIFKKLFIDYIK